MHDTVKGEGKKFVLVLLPVRSDLWNYKHNPKFKEEYDTMKPLFESEDIMCIDLMRDFLETDPSQLDTGYSGDHYGPKTNERISELLGDKMVELNLLKNE